MHLTIKIVFEHLDAAAVRDDHTEACRVRSRKTLADAKESESSRAVCAGVRSIAKMTVELQQQQW